MGQEPSGPSSHAGTLPLHGAWREAGERWDVAEAPSSGGPSHYGWTRPPENGPGGGPSLQSWPGSSSRSGCPHCLCTQSEMVRRQPIRAHSPPDFPFTGIWPRWGQGRAAQHRCNV